MTFFTNIMYWESSSPSRGDVGNIEDRRMGLSAIGRAYEAEQRAVGEVEAALRKIEEGAHR